MAGRPQHADRILWREDNYGKVQSKRECCWIRVRNERRMNAETILGVILVAIGAVILYFSAIGIAFMWILKQAQRMMIKDIDNDARKP